MKIEAKKFGEVLNEWFRTMGRNWKPLLLMSVLAHIPVALVVTSVFWLSDGVDSFLLLLDEDLLEELTSSELFDVLLPFVWTMAAWVILQSVAAIFVYIAGARIVAADLAGDPPTLRGVGGFAAGRTVVATASVLLVTVGAVVLLGGAGAAGWALIALYGANFGTVFVTTVLALTALVIQIWLALSVSLGPQVIALEDAGPFLALTRSFQLVKGRWWMTFGFFAVSGMIAYAASQILSIALVPIFLIAAVVPAAFAVAFGVSLVAQGPLLAAYAAAYALWYVDLRARQEDLVAEQLI